MPPQPEDRPRPTDGEGGGSDNPLKSAWEKVKDAVGARGGRDQRDEEKGEVSPQARAERVDPVRDVGADEERTDIHDVGRNLDEARHTPLDRVEDAELPRHAAHEGAPGDAGGGSQPTTGEQTESAEAEAGAGGASDTPREPSEATAPTAQHRAQDYEDLTVEELRDLAGERDITGRWDMTKDELITELRRSEG